MVDVDLSAAGPSEASAPDMDVFAAITAAVAYAREHDEGLSDAIIEGGSFSGSIAGDGAITITAGSASVTVPASAILESESAAGEALDDVSAASVEAPGV